MFAVNSHSFLALASLILGVIFLLCSAFISAAEFSIFSLSQKDIHSLGDSDKKSAKRLLELLRYPEDIRVISLLVDTCLNILVVVSFLCFSYLRHGFFEFGLGRFALLVLFIAFVLLFFGEILPQMMASQNAKKIAMRMSLTMMLLKRMMFPLVRFLSRRSYAWSMAMGAYGKMNGAASAEKSHALDLRSAATDEDQEMIDGIIKFGNIEVSDIMCSRMDLVDINIKAHYVELLELVIKSGYSRIPVYGENRDNVLGLIYSKDLLSLLDRPADFEWQTLMRPVYFVPESKKIDDLLREFQTNKVHFAVVVDEYGGTSGVVTLEDILEEIVGDISDEYDEDEGLYVKIDDNTYIFEGKMLLNDFYKVTGIDEERFEEVDEEVESLAGLILEIKGEMPAPKEKIEYHGFLFEILAVDSRRIKKVKLYCNTDN